MTVHRIANMEVMIGYADVHGDLLPINNDENFSKAVSMAHPLLRIFIQRQGSTAGLMPGKSVTAFSCGQRQTLPVPMLPSKINQYPVAKEFL
ncbi:hypothetical protein DNTS_014847 [Danionella cerebrum]|uniref:PB1 domain-containing protein n=1 Tax=Danionella cerebrum TaxID=2873325 RepID=A0A553N264_9TELE|nr:hypothetical protein DNTS_014847 [Danionella translucida]